MPKVGTQRPPPPSTNPLRGARHSSWLPAHQRGEVAATGRGTTLACPPPPTQGTHLRQVGQSQFSSMGRKSLANCLFFTGREPQGTRAEPKRWEGKDLAGHWDGGQQGVMGWGV